MLLLLRGTLLPWTNIFLWCLAYNTDVRSLQNGQVELDGAFKPANSIVQLNLAVGAACLLAVGGVEALTLWRLHLCRQAKLSWCHFG